MKRYQVTLGREATLVSALDTEHARSLAAARMNVTAVDARRMDIRELAL